MPTGIIVNVISVILGSVSGIILKRIIPDKLKENLMIYFGFGAMAIGIVAIVKLNSLPIVVLSIIIGSIIGELLNIDANVKKSISRLLNKTIDDDAGLQKKNILAVLIAIFCFSGTGIFGVLNEAMTGDSSILLAKSVLDFFTAMIFATSIGIAVSFIAIPQLIVFVALFLVGRVTAPYLAVDSINNLIAVGGIITLMIGINISRIKQINVLNSIPSFIVVVILSQLFSA